MRPEEFKNGVTRLRLRGLAVALAVLGVAQVAGGPHGEWLRYSRTEIQGGAYWRLLTGHLVHFDMAHATLNVAGLILLWLLFVADARARQWACVACVSAVSISTALWCYHPEIAWYLGLSGVLHGVWAAASVHALTRWRLEAIVSGALLCCKLLIESRFGALSDPLLGHALPVVVVAHLYGAIGGLLTAVVQRRVTAL